MGTDEAFRGAPEEVRELLGLLNSAELTGSLAGDWPGEGLARELSIRGPVPGQWRFNVQLLRDPPPKT
jgi:hypothetical protein